MEYSINSTSIVFSQFLNSSQISSTTQQTLLTQITNILTLIYYFLAAYYLPLTMILTVLNNFLCLVVFFCSKEFYEKTSKTSRIYYILLALADVAANYTYCLSFFPGDGIYTITNGKLAM